MRFLSCFLFLAQLFACAKPPDPYSDIKFSHASAASSDRAVIYIYTSGSVRSEMERNIILNLEFIGRLRIAEPPDSDRFYCEFLKREIEPGLLTVEFLELTWLKVPALERDRYIAMRRSGRNVSPSRFFPARSQFQVEAGTVTFVRVKITQSPRETLNELEIVPEDKALSEISRCFLGTRAT
jgi:hypothetical protein